MVEPSTLEYLNTIAGYLSLIVSISALWFGVAGYRKAQSIKQLDLRLEYRKKKAALDLDLAFCLNNIDQVKKSRQRSFSADGLLRSGQSLVFKQQWERWKKELANLQDQCSEDDLAKKSEADLELGLGVIEIARLRAKELRSSLELSLAEDQKNADRRIQAAERRANNQ